MTLPKEVYEENQKRQRINNSEKFTEECFLNFGFEMSTLGYRLHISHEKEDIYSITLLRNGFGNTELITSGGMPEVFHMGKKEDTPKIYKDFLIAVKSLLQNNTYNFLEKYRTDIAQDSEKASDKTKTEAKK